MNRRIFRFLPDARHVFPARGDKALPLFSGGKNSPGYKLQKQKHPPVFGACILGEPRSGEGKALSRRSREKSFSCLVTKISSRVFQCRKTVSAKKSSSNRRAQRGRGVAHGAAVLMLLRKNSVITRENWRDYSSRSNA